MTILSKSSTEGVSLMNARKMATITMCLLIAQLFVGCALLDKEEEELQVDRRVKVVAFPVRPLEFVGYACHQKSYDMQLSGSLKNISPYLLSNVRVRAEVFFAESVPREQFILSADPAQLHPGQSARFSHSGTVQHPIAKVELHALWENPSYP